MPEFTNCIKRELSRKTGDRREKRHLNADSRHFHALLTPFRADLTPFSGWDRREDVFALLERGMDGGKRLVKKQEEGSDEEDDEACLALVVL